MGDTEQGVAFELGRGDIRETRFTEFDVPEPGDGEAVLEVERFGLTANNVTYAVFGDAMNYWDFFPSGDPEWGRMPVWGFGRVAASKNPGVEEGSRVYGYFPCASHLHVVPERANDRGFADGAEHRKPLPSAYQRYRAVASDPAYKKELENEQIIFWPLFYTSFLVDDLIAAESFYGGTTVALSSASSKTALIAAFLLAQREGAELVGLTSSRNRDWVKGLNIYDEVLTYDEIGDLPSKGLVYADFSGDAGVRTAIHEHARDGLSHSMSIGATHWDEMTAASPDPLPGPKPQFFFAPDRIKIRGEEWGAAVLEEKVDEAWHPFAEWSSGWLEAQPGEGRDDVERVYRAVLEGEIGPEAGPVLTLR
jgi:NADPH:quinone reductase-like Zn-dependent oxidoreductase